jgi:hypothetical protein
MRRHGQSPVHCVPSAERQWCLHELSPIRSVAMYAPSSARTAIIRKERWFICSRHLGRGRNLTCPSVQPRPGSPEPRRHRAAAHSCAPAHAASDNPVVAISAIRQAKARRSIHVAWPALRAEKPTPCAGSRSRRRWPVMEQAGGNDEIPQKLQNEIAELAQKLTNTMQKIRDEHTKHSL